MRVSVSVDLSKPLPNSIVVQGVSYRLEFEKLSAVCLSCGVFGHFKAQCTLEPDFVKRREENRSGEIVAQRDRGKQGDKLDPKSGDQWKVQGKKRWIPKSSKGFAQFPATGSTVEPPASTSLIVANSFDALEGVVDSEEPAGFHPLHLEACVGMKGGEQDAASVVLENSEIEQQVGSLRELAVEAREGNLQKEEASVTDRLQVGGVEVFSVNCENETRNATAVICEQISSKENCEQVLNLVACDSQSRRRPRKKLALMGLSLILSSWKAQA